MIKIIIVAAMALCAISMFGQVLNYNSLNGLRFAATNAPHFYDFTFHYGRNQVIEYNMDGSVCSCHDYRIYVRGNRTYLELIGGYTFVIERSYWDYGRLVGIDMWQGSIGLNLRLQPIVGGDYYYFVD